MAIALTELKENEEAAITFEPQQLIDQIHNQYLATISTLMQENATLMTMVNNAEVLIMELKMKVEALTED